MGKCELALSAVLLLLYVLDVSLSTVEFVPFANDHPYQHECNNTNAINKQSNKTQTLITKKEEETQQLAVQIQEMQAAMQKAAVEAAKAVAAGNA